MKRKEHHYENAAVAVSRETEEKLEVFVKLLEKWNQKINLVSRQDIENIRKRHIIDSLQLAPFVNGHDKVLDMGSGGGFPAIIVAIVTAVPVVMVESDARKASFLREALRVLALEGEVLCARVEKVNISPVNVVTARALASMDVLLKWAVPLLRKEGMGLFLKGKTVTEEIEQARQNWVMDIEVYPSITSSEGVIIKVTNVEAV
ncbi:16S rRNA (guanine(527)-N(7))-methyltransferase RsmG [Entomobacter blattae]|uniref:16S rRNA (guanine(527)-N(7))-methyltransferase RsmG n=1 Tax=Entomobacter blattae TaxID=2762277 RepID=UPI001EEFC5C4|nr:16S rRNA (guanine(527)-N(7))-methyltransferase RsmG [Entomobacter blattae]